jgi:hypothetical protein
MNEEKTDVDWMDISDRLIKDRNAIGFLADNVKDVQLSALLSLIEESMLVSAQMITFLMEKGLDEEIAEQQPAESVPFD